MAETETGTETETDEDKQTKFEEAVLAVLGKHEESKTAKPAKKTAKKTTAATDTDDDDDADDDAADDAGGKKTTGEEGIMRSMFRTEADMEEAVRKAIAKIKKEEDTENRLKKVEKKVTEAPPKQIRGITKLLWGSDDK